MNFPQSITNKIKKFYKRHSFTVSPAENDNMFIFAGHLIGNPEIFIGWNASGDCWASLDNCLFYRRKDFDFNPKSEDD